MPEKYQVFLDVVSGQGSQREIADKWRLDRSTVAGVCKTARQGALADNTRLRDALAEQAIELHLVGKERWD